MDRSMDRSMFRSHGEVSAAAQSAHRLAVERGESTYVDPDTGYMVFTSVSHLERGTCCGNGCRHCPFSHEERLASGAVPAD